MYLAKLDLGLVYGMRKWSLILVTLPNGTNTSIIDAVAAFLVTCTACYSKVLHVT